MNRFISRHLSTTTQPSYQPLSIYSVTAILVIIFVFLFIAFVVLGADIFYANIAKKHVEQMRQIADSQPDVLETVNGYFDEYLLKLQM